MDSKSTFQIVACASLSDDDLKTLVLLYQPIIGMTSYSFYMTLYNLISRQTFQSKTYPHQFLYDLLAIKQQAATKIRHKLEAIGLIDVYQKDNHYLYKLKFPLTARQFLSDTILGQFLRSQVGDKMYNELTSDLVIAKLDTSSYQQVTKQFDQVYEFKSLGYKDHNDYLGRRGSTGVVIGSAINYEKFVELLPQRYLNTSLLNWKTRDYIEKLAFVYNFNEEDMAQIYKKTVSPNNQIELEQINLKARLYYESKHNTIAVVEEKMVDKKKLEVQSLNTTSPQRILELFCKVDYQGQATETIFNLINRNQVEIGVINTLVMHILKAKDGVLPHINYLEKVLETWLNKGIRTTSDAYEFVMNIDNNKEINKKAKPNKNKVVKEYPEWVDDYLKDFENMEYDDEN